MSVSCTSGCYNGTLQLYNYLMNNPNYSPQISPGVNYNSMMTIYISFALVKLLKLTNSGIISVAGSLIMAWIDPRLTWTPSNYNNVSSLTVPGTNIWTPQLSLRNGVSENLNIPFDNNSVVGLTYNGFVNVALSRQFDVTCSLDLTYFPYDSQTCNLIFQNIDFRSSSVSLTYSTLNGVKSVDTEIFTKGGEFTFITSAVTTSSYCLATYGQCFPIFNVSLTFKRNSEYYVSNVVIPSILLLFASGLGFLIPSDNNVKIGMSCSLMVALYVLQQAVARLLPATGSTPYLAKGIMFELGLGCYSVLCAVITFSLRTYQPKISPPLLKLIHFFDCSSCKDTKIKPCTKTNDAKTGKIFVIRDQQSTISSDSEKDPSSGDKIELLTAAINKLAQSNVMQLDKNEEADRQRLEAAQHRNNWQTLDRILNVVLLLIYVCVAVTIAVVFLFGAG